MGFNRLTFWIWTFVTFFLLYIWFRSTLNSVSNDKTRFFQSQVLLDFSLILLFEVNWLWLQFYRTWSHVIGYLIVSYESSDSQLEGGEKVEPIPLLYWPEIMSDKSECLTFSNFKNHKILVILKYIFTKPIYDQIFSRQVMVSWF